MYTEYYNLFIFQLNVQGNEKGPDSLSDMVRQMFSQHVVWTCFISNNSVLVSQIYIWLIEKLCMLVESCTAKS